MLVMVSKIISINQSGFVKGKTIIVTFKYIDLLSKKMKNFQGNVALRLISKWFFYTFNGDYFVEVLKAFDLYEVLQLYFMYSSIW